MLSKCIGNKNLLTNILTYLETEEILTFYKLNKAISAKLNFETNYIINSLFYEYASDKLYNFDYTEENQTNLDKIKRKQIILGKSWESKTNWRLFLSNANRDLISYPDEEIAKKVIKCFKIHAYLPDLRKEDKNLEFHNSSIHQIFCYDKKFRDNCSYIYYNKYINQNYINKNGINSKVNILKEGLFFEDKLKNFIDTYNEFARNKEYVDIIKDANNYDFEKLYKNYDEKNFPKNDLIFFVLYIIRNYINYSKYILEKINKAKTEGDKTNFLEVFSQEYNNYVNAGLLIDNNFANINIIINLFNRLYLKNDAVFSLYYLGLRIYNKIVYDKVSVDLLNNITLLYRNIIIKKIEIKNEDIDDMEIEDSKTSDMSLDDISLDDYLDYNDSNKEQKIFEDFSKNILDLDIDEENANAINHSKIKLGKAYNDYEARILDTLNEVIKEKKSQIPLEQIFDQMENLLTSEESKKNSRNSLKIINKTKKAMLIGFYEMLIPDILSQLSKDFNSHIKRNEDGSSILVLSNKEKMNNIKYNCDLSDFSRKKRMKIEEKVENDIKEVKYFLFGKSINGFDIQETLKLIDEYMDNNGIECVSLIKKIIYFYNKECFRYDDIDQKVFNILTNTYKEEEKRAFNEIINLYA